MFFNHLGRSLLPYILLYEIDLKPMCLYRLRQFINKKYRFSVTISSFQYMLKSLTELDYLTRKEYENRKVYYITNEGVLASKNMKLDINPLLNLLKIL